MRQKDVTYSAQNTIRRRRGNGWSSNHFLCHVWYCRKQENKNKQVSSLVSYTINYSFTLFFPCSTVALKCKQTESTAAAWRDLAFALPWKFMRASSLLYWRKETWRKAKQTRRSSQLLIREKEYDEPKYCNRAPTLCCCCCCFYIYWIYIQVKLLTDAIYWRHPILAIRIV